MNMNPMRFFSVLAALVLLGGLNLAIGADKVLVPGDPPLTQEVVDLYQQMWEWYCELRLTPEQRGRHTQLFISEWKKQDRTTCQKLLASYRAAESRWRDALKMKETEQGRKRAQDRERWMGRLRKSTGPSDRLLVSVFDAAYKPGGSKNPIIVDGDPPLTQVMLDLETAAVELILDLQFTDEQRREFRTILIDAWKESDPDEKRKWTRSTETWAALPTWSAYRRTLQRALKSAVREGWSKGTSAGERWLSALDQATSRPGSTRNPVLVDSQPPLTQLVVDRYGDYLEVMLDLSVSGGFTTAQREALQEHLVNDWKTMNTAARNDLLADLKRWSVAAGQGGAEANKCIAALRPKLLAQIQTAQDKPQNRWMSEVLDQERALVKRKTRVLEQRAEMQRIVDETRQYPGFPGHWEYDGNARKLKWVPDR
jgi:hypothetical protein